MERERQNNIELLRVTAMLMVTMQHVLGHGGVLERYPFGTPGYFLFWLLETLCFVAVNCFVLITGYFMVNAKLYPSRILKLMVQVEFFSVFCLCLTRFVFHRPIGTKNLVCALFPLTGKVYWFASSYVVLLLLIPFLNKLICSMTKKELVYANILLLFLFVVAPTFFFWSRGWLTDGYNFIWFIVLYFAAAYIRLYGFSLSGKKCIFLYLIFSGAGYASRILITAATEAFIGEAVGEGILYSYNSVVFYPASVCLFLAFLRLPVKQGRRSKIIAGFGALSFGAYLCSDHALIRKPLWDWIGIRKKTTECLPIVLGNILIVVFCIFAAGCAAEWMRRKVMRLIGFDKLLKKIDIRFENDKKEGACIAK